MTRPYKHHKRTVRKGDIISTIQLDDIDKQQFRVEYTFKRKPFLSIYKQDPLALLNKRIIIETVLTDIIKHKQPVIVTPYIDNYLSFNSLFSRIKQEPQFNSHKFTISRIDNDITISLVGLKPQLTLDYYHTNKITLTSSHLSIPGLLLSILRILITIPVRITFTGSKSSLELELNHLIGYTKQSQSLRIISQPDDQSHDLRILDQSKLAEILSEFKEQ